MFVVVGFFMCGVLIMYLHVTVWRVFVRWCVQVVGRLGKQDTVSCKIVDQNRAREVVSFPPKRMRIPK